MNALAFHVSRQQREKRKVRPIEKKPDVYITGKVEMGGNCRIEILIRSIGLLTDALSLLNSEKGERDSWWSAWAVAVVVVNGIKRGG